MSFFSGSRQCKCRSTSSDKSLSTNLPSTVEIPPKFSLLAGAHYAGLLQIFFHFNIFVFTWAICIINCNVTGRYGLYITHFSLLEMSVITGYLCIVTCFLHRQNYGASLSLRAYRWHAQNSFKMSVIIQMLIVAYFCIVICLEIDQIHGKEETRPTKLFYFTRGVTITVSEWSPKVLYNLDTSEKFLHWL